jgi:hypothetical protein
MPMISIGAADIATGCTDESRYWDSERSEIVRVDTRLEKRAAFDYCVVLLVSAKKFLLPTQITRMVSQTRDSLVRLPRSSERALGHCVSY